MSTKTTTTTSSNVGMFETATRAKLRFKSTRGELSIEQLWDVPLRPAKSGDDFHLDDIAKRTNRELKELSEESFVESRKSPTQTRLELAMDVILFVIKTKQDEEDLAKKRAAKAKEKEELLEILAEKQKGEMKELSVKDIQKRIAALSADDD